MLILLFICRCPYGFFTFGGRTVKILLFYLPSGIARLCGSGKISPSMLGMASEYLFYYTAFSVPMMMSNCLSVFVRNDGSPALAFWGMCAGAAANIFLDWLFIFPLRMGIVGAAVASGLGQVAAVAILASHFLRKRGELRLRKVPAPLPLAKKIMIRGIPEAASQLNTPVTALCYNLVLADRIGDMGISTFSVLSFIFSLANAVLSGVAQGLQPLWGDAYGKQDESGIKYYLRRGILLNFVLSVLIYVFLFTFDLPVIRFFNQDVELVEMASAALPVFALSFPPMALNLILTAMFFSTKRTDQADIIAFCRGVAVKALCIFYIPFLFGANAVWFYAALSEMITLAIAAAFYRFRKAER